MCSFRAALAAATVWPARSLGKASLSGEGKKGRQNKSESGGMHQSLKVERPNDPNALDLDSSAALALP